jgi:phosphatidylglycerophosphate synthase
MPTPWTLVLENTAHASAKKLGGLSTVLRLALDAQRSHATQIVFNGNDPALLASLHDPRLKIPVVSTVPGDGLRVVVPAHWVLHRQSFAALSLESRPADATLEVPRDICPDVPFAFKPVEVVDAESARTAERFLFRALRKPEDGWTARWFNRYVSLAISRWLAKTPLLPNQLSVVILAIGLYGAWLASHGNYLSMLIGATLFQLQSILDGCDGELSRVTYRGSKLGEWLDTVGDDVTNYSFFVGAAVGLFQASGSTVYLWVGGVMLVCGVLGSGIEYRYLISIGSGDLLKYPLSQATSKRDGRFGFIAPLFKRDTFVFLTWLAAALNIVGITLVAFAAGAIGVLFSVLMTEARMAKERKVARTS